MWHRVFPRFCGRFFFSALTVRGAEHLPRDGPVLWIALHRNGAVDGFAYAAALSRPLVFMLSTQLRKHFLTRIFFNGIAVARNATEGDRDANRAALAQCLDLWRAGGELFVFPEGTSTLGPRHLPFKAGVAQLACDWLVAGPAEPGTAVSDRGYMEQGGTTLRVVPLGVHYDRPWAFRSDAEIVVGPAIDLALAAESTPLARLREMKRRMAAALEAVGANFPDEAAQEEAEALATLAAIAANRSRFEVLKACERREMVRARAAWRELAATAAQTGAWHYRGVPLLPRDSGVCEFLELAVLGPVVLAGILANAGPWIGATWAAKKFPDGRNVIALWKILAGLPLLALWFAATVVASAWSGAWMAFAGYLLLTVVAWAGYDRVCRSAVALGNWIFHPRLRDPFHRAIAHCRRPIENHARQRPAAHAA